MKSLLLLITLLACSSIFMAQTSDPQTGAPALITTTGEASVYVKPDEVHFTININVEGDDLLDAKQQNGAAANKAIAYLKAQGVEDRYIQTQYLNVSVQYRDREQRQPRYYANQSINVCLKEVDSFERINIGLLELGVSGINGPRFKHSGEEELRKTASQKAVVDAKAKASLLAAALGQSIGKAYRIDASSGNRGDAPILYARAMSMEASNDASGPGIASGELQIKETVTVSFYLD